MSGERRKRKNWGEGRGKGGGGGWSLACLPDSNFQVRWWRKVEGKKGKGRVEPVVLTSIFPCSRGGKGGRERGTKKKRGGRSARFFTSIIILFRRGHGERGGGGESGKGREIRLTLLANLNYLNLAGGKTREKV